MTRVEHARAAKGATPVTTAVNAAALGALPFDDLADQAEVRRGLIAEAPAEKIVTIDGRVVWEPTGYRSDDARPAPATVHPGLWRQSRLDALAGLFEVADGIYQVRGLDLANMTIIEGATGLIVIDPLSSVECAKVGMDLYHRSRGERPVAAVIYTDSQIDHYGGVKAVVSKEAVEAGGVRVYAAEGFLPRVVSDNVLAGTATSRRSHYEYGLFLPRNAHGHLDLGLGRAISTGTITLIAPTDPITSDGSRVVDGVEIEIRLTPDGLAQMSLYFPRQRALWVADHACHTLADPIPPRGAPARDPRQWARYLDDAVDRFGARTDVLFASHHWPTWGTEQVIAFLADRRDAYQFLHDQTLRLANHGYTAPEIAEVLTRLPPRLADTWHLRGYQGTISQQVRAVYQRYLGAYDGNPAHLRPYPPVAAGERYVAAMGGAQRVLDLGRAAFAAGDYRWTAELVNHLVFAEPGNTAAVALQADALEQLGYQSESGSQRSSYLTGAHELRHGVRRGINLTTVSRDTIKAMTVDLYFDYLAVRLNADKARHLSEIRLDWVFPDLTEAYALTLRNAALTYRVGQRHPSAHATVTLAKETLDAVTVGQTTFARAIAEGAVEVSGDRATLFQLLSLFDDFPLMFPVVTP